MDSENKQRYTVIISDEAAQMLVSHARFLVQVSESAALRLIEVFNERVKSLEIWPERNPRLIDPSIPAGKYRKLLMEKRYLLIYQIKAGTVYVDAVLDTRQDYGWLLR
jgi:plasmid stabilization system protein ParE